MRALRYAWLPDHHLDVASTLAHADEVISQASCLLLDYQTQPGGIIELRESSTNTRNRLIVAGIAPIPKKIPLLVADALNALRNALEHTLFAEVEFRDGVLNRRAAKQIQMPAMETYSDFHNWVEGRTKSGPPSLRRGGDLLKRIEDLQPFHRTRDAKSHPMAVLALHTNHSKHRAPVITAVGLAGVLRDDGSPLSLADFERRPETPIQVGDVIAEAPRGVQIPLSLYPTIGVNRPGTDRWPALILELKELSEWVRLQAVPRIITGEAPPMFSLPAWYEIASGHMEERLALSEGVADSATDRYRERLTAATLRSSMAETLSRMDSAPSLEETRAWFASLSDREVIDRMRQLNPNSYGDVTTVLNNVAVLETMRDDARRFADVEGRSE